MAKVDPVALEAALLDAHERRDVEALVFLYQQAASIKKSEGDIDAFWFLTTHAYVFALECGHADAAHLYKALKSAGRDE